jgi:zinc/manganese transport system substrate-binding protein
VSIRLLHTLAGALAATLLLGACTSSAVPSSAGGRLRVVAVENFWGSLAAQLGGDQVDVTSIIRDPNADPHDYEPRPSDAARLAGAQYAVVNGAGYDGWATKLLAASPNRKRVTLDVGRLTGTRAGENPHRWYSPDDVRTVIDRMTADYKRLAPGDAALFDQRHDELLTTGMARYFEAVDALRARFAGTPIGASESIVVPLAEDTGLRVVTPASFLNAISEGAEPTAADKATCDAQIDQHRIRAFVFNPQNATPDVRAQTARAAAAGIPVVAMTETLTPAGASFQDWQAAQLESLVAALSRSGGSTGPPPGG